MSKITLLLIISLSFLFCLIYFSKHFEFINKTKLLKILSHKDYLNTFSKIDLSVRNVNNTEEYIHDKIVPSLSVSNIFEKLRLICLSLYVDISIFRNKSNKYLNKTKLIQIPWKIGIVNGNLYEEGLPHTRNGNIIISRNTLNNSSNKDLAKILLHEKVHVYQYLYKDETQKYIEKKGFKKLRRREKNVRANPDIDLYTYTDSSGNKYRATYRKNASSILDVKYDAGNSQSYEHPYESMAIELEKMVK